MNTNGIVVLAGGIVIVSQWAEGKSLGFKTAMGIGFAGFGIAILGDFAPDIAQGLALLMLVAAALNAAPLFGNVAKAVG